jgi:glycyl-tRNA synthetase beta chain
MAELLLELFSEEIPARMQKKACESLESMLADKFKSANITYTNIKCYVTPRRLTAHVEGLPVSLPDQTTEKKGPRTDSNEATINGFLSSYKDAKIEKRQTDKGEFYFLTIHQKGINTKEFLQNNLPDLLSNFPWPKSMKWGDYPIRWVRPLKNILCILDEEVVPFEFGHLKANNKSQGHRFLSKDEFTVTNFTDYESKLKNAYVILNQEERKKVIEEQINKLAADNNLQIKSDIGLLEEVTGLVEIPNAIIGSINQEFMDLPSEVLHTSMRSHQKYFVLEDNNGNFTPFFITVCNTDPKADSSIIVQGNEKVLRARLTDAVFFFEQDKKQTLEARVESLGRVTFHAKLGSMLEKTNRIVNLASEISKYIDMADAKLAERAALLCKIDLVTGMVGEFAELQGIIGSYYAKFDGEDERVANAIREHYQPQGPSDKVPANPISICVALADKIDSLVGLFIAGEKPTGSKDPFALRRAALGIIRIITENKINLNLSLILSKAVENFATAPKDIYTELTGFFTERLKYSLKAEGIRHDIIAAVFDTGSYDNILLSIAKVKATQEVLLRSGSEQIIHCFKRVLNILSIEEKKDKASYEASIDHNLLKEPIEQNLVSLLDNTLPEVTRNIEANNFIQAIEKVASLKSAVDEFFDNLQVNTSDVNIRKNRLAILASIRSILLSVANFALIE